jgi:hypothetical protein
MSFFGVKAPAEAIRNAIKLAGKIEEFCGLEARYDMFNIERSMT